MAQVPKNSKLSLQQNIFNEFINSQLMFESKSEQLDRKASGLFLTNNLVTVDKILDVINFDSSIFDKKILEPACGCGIFLLKIILKLYQSFQQEESTIFSFIQNNLFFADINLEMIETTQNNISKLYYFMFSKAYTGKFNSFNIDFTRKIPPISFEHDEKELRELYEKIDYIIGNPPYVTLYGRRDQKQSESQRVYYLQNYRQFPASLKNGKINYAMLFIEHSLDFLKYGGRLSFILDTTFFESAYVHTRKYLLENSQIDSVEYNVKDFDVASGQIILKLTKKRPDAKTSYVNVFNAVNQQSKVYNQFDWYKEDDEFKFRISMCAQSDQIIAQIIKLQEKTLSQLYPQKNLRTCAMLLDMEDKFVYDRSDLRNNVKVYPYYQGSKSLKDKFDLLEASYFLYYDKKLQDWLNNRLKIELEKVGIKNKKRIGLGEEVIYDHPKVYIRQSAKSIIAAYDENPSSANNSLYVFTLRGKAETEIKFLKFLCGYLNSDLVTFYAQQRQIIRYRIGKQPQIKIADLYSIPVPSSNTLIDKVAQLVDDIHQNNSKKQSILAEINKYIYEYYALNQKDTIAFISSSIQSF